LSCKRPRMFSTTYVCNVIIKRLILRFLCQNTQSAFLDWRMLASACTVRSSVQNVVTKGSARLRARSSVLTSKLHAWEHAYAYSTCTAFLKILLMVRDGIWCFSLQPFVTLTKPQCQETNAHYILKYYKWNAWVTLTYFNGEWSMWAR